MDIATLNAKITIQKCTSSTDEVGNVTQIWKDYFSCFATISSNSGNENLTGSVNEEENINFTIRYCKAVSNLSSTEYRVVFRNNPYDIKYIDLMNNKHKSIKLKCRLSGEW